MIRNTVEMTKGKVDLIEFESPEDLAYSYETWKDYKYKGDVGEYLNEKQDSFYGEPTSMVAESLRKGWDKGAKESDKILSYIEDQFDFDTEAFRTVNNVTGGSPNVGAFLSGHPMNMRLRKRVMEDINPVTIYVDCTVSGGTGHKEIMNRGIAALALTRVVSRVRPVKLYMIGGLKNLHVNNVMLFPVETTPLDLARASYMMARPELLRRIMFLGISHNVEHFHGETCSGWIPWLFNDHDWQKKNLASEVARIQGVDEYMAVEGTIHSGKGERGTIESAAGWVVESAKSLLKTKEM